MSFRPVKTFTTQIVKRKIGKCPYCGSKTRIGEKFACKHVKACAPVHGDSGEVKQAIWRFERKAPSRSAPRMFRKLQDVVEKHERSSATDRVMKQWEHSEEIARAEADRKLIAESMAHAAIRGGSKSRYIFVTEGLSEYLKPKYKRQLTILKDMRNTYEWSQMEPLDKRIAYGKIRFLSAKIREAKKLKRLGRL